MSKAIILSGAKAFSKAMKDAEKTMLKAATTAVNKTAFTARKNAVSNIEKNFTLRNNFTTKNIFTTPSQKATSFENIVAYTGALAPAEYMERQEKGGTKKSPSGKNLIIPNTRARGGSNLKKVQSKYYLSNVQNNSVKWSKRTGSAKARLVATAFIAAKTKKFIRMNNSFFLVNNFHKGKKKVSFKLRQILNLKHKSTLTPAKPWLDPASESASKLMATFYSQEMDKL